MDTEECCRLDEVPMSPSSVLIPSESLKVLQRLKTLREVLEDNPVTAKELLRLLVDAKPAALWIAGFTSDAGLTKVLGDGVGGLIRHGAFRLLVSSSDLVTLALARVLATCAKRGTSKDSDLGKCLANVLRIASMEGQSLHAKLYLFHYDDVDGSTADVAVLGSANPTWCGLNVSDELSTVLAARDSEGTQVRLLQWLRAWYEQRWQSASEYEPPRGDSIGKQGEFLQLWYQEQVLDWLDDAWRLKPKEAKRIIDQQGNASFPGHLVVLPTGAGKTRLTLEWIARHWELGEPIEVLWLTHLRELVVQTGRMLNGIWRRCQQIEGRQYQDGEQRDGTHPSATLPFKVLTRKSAAGEYPELYRRPWDVIVVDEAHHLGLDGVEYPRILSKARARMLVGLSATPWRTPHGDTPDESVAQLFPDTVDNRIAPITLAEAVAPPDGLPPILSHLSRHIVDTGFTMELSPDETSFEIRNQKTFQPFISEEAVEVVASAWYESLGKTLVFALTRPHADRLEAKYKVLFPKARVLCAHSGRKPPDNSSALDEFRNAAEEQQVILVSVGMFLEGLDFPTLRTVVMARPTRSTLLYTQMLGRVLRGPRLGGTKTAYAIEYFVRTKEDESKDASKVRNRLFTHALLRPPKAAHAKTSPQWAPPPDWGLDIPLPEAVRARLKPSLKALKELVVEESTHAERTRLETEQFSRKERTQKRNRPSGRKGRHQGRMNRSSIDRVEQARAEVVVYASDKRYPVYESSGTVEDARSCLMRQYRSGKKGGYRFIVWYH